MPELRRLSYSPKSKGTPYRKQERKFTNPDSRSGLPRRASFNSRLGANGPAEPALQDSENKSSENEWDTEDIRVKLANLSADSTPEALCKKSFNGRFWKPRSTLDENSGNDVNVEPDKTESVISREALCKKSFNDRLWKSRNTVDENSEDGVNVEPDKTESVISSESPVQPSIADKLDKIISEFIKEEVTLAGHQPEHQGFTYVVGESSKVRSFGPTLDTMSKRDHLGIEKNGKTLSSNGSNRRYTLDEVVITEESPLEIAENSRAATLHLKESDRNATPSQPRESLSSATSSQSSELCSNVTPSRPSELDKKSFSRGSDIYQPKKSESPLSTPEKFSRRDFPTSFGSGGKRFKHYDCDIIDEVEKYFSKRFYLSSTCDWKLPEPSEVFSAEPWEVKELIECKDKLNAVKEKLNDLPLKEWHTHTKRRNKAGQVVWFLRKTVNPEFPTQAWCKFYENVCSFELVPEKAQQHKKLSSVHLCEAPGAFITSLNHYVKTNFDDDFEWNWLGTTLNPHYEGNPLSLMINEDRFILHTMENWTFGEDQTGDLMVPPNVAHLMDKAEALGEVLLVTADGSIDCQDDPGEQESYVAWLHYCEAFCALMVLGEGGNFLLKMFTMFEHMTVSLLYLLSCVFKEVIINKPATSKEGNSETYVVCKHYVGKQKIESILSTMIVNYGPNMSRKALFPKESIPQEFIDAVIECADTFRNYQSDIIEANLESYRNPSNNENSKIQTVRRAVTEEFFRRYKLKELPERFDMVGRHLINKMETYNMDPRLEVGTFSDKLKRAQFPERQKILDLKEVIERLDRQVLDHWPTEENIWWYKFDCEPGYNLSKDMKISTGKPVKRINSSKFCLGRLLDIRNEVREIILESKVFKLPSSNRFTEQLLKVPNATSVLDFKNALWSSSDAGLNAEEEYRAFKKIIKEFDSLSRDDNMVIYGYPLLTQFNVGLVYLLAHSFERVGLTRPKGQNFGVIFEKHDVSNKKFRVKEKLDEISESIEVDSSGGKTVLAMLPIQKLCKGEFYKYITMANNICVKEQVLEIIDEYLTATESKEDREKRRWTTN